MAIRVKKITYTPADIFAMNGTPQNVLAAPAAGYVNNILAISHDMVFNSAAYTGATDLIYGYDATLGTGLFYDTVSLAALADTVIPCGKITATNPIFTTSRDFYITTNGPAATGDSDIIAYVVYETKLLDT